MNMTLVKGVGLKRGQAIKHLEYCCVFWKVAFGSSASSTVSDTGSRLLFSVGGQLHLGANGAGKLQLQVAGSGLELIEIHK